MKKGKKGKKAGKVTKEKKNIITDLGFVKYGLWLFPPWVRDEYNLSFFGGNL